MEGDRLSLFSPGKLEVTLLRLAHQLIENHKDFKNSVMIGIQPRGIFLSRRMHSLLKRLLPDTEIPYGELDVTFHRDDFRRHSHPLKAETTRIEFLLEEKRVILVDDVLFTGRTVRAAMDAMQTFGRPASVELLVLIDRQRWREVPIEAEYTGLIVDTLITEIIVRLKKGEDNITIEERKEIK